LRYRILVILGLAVVVLVIYTIAFRARPVVAKLEAAGVQRLSLSVPTEVPSGARAKEISPPAVESSAPTAAVPAGQPAPKETEPIVWASDPFVREWVMINEVANLNLKAITIGGERASALINDQILEEGDVISGKRVIAIEPEKVTLEQGGRTFTLMLGE